MSMFRKFSAGSTILRRLAVVLTLTFSAGCAINIVGTNPDRLDATVRFIGIEGGCWSLDVGGGTRYQPINLPDSYRVDGRRVSVVLSQRRDLSSFCMIGPMVEIESIRDRE